VGLHQNGLGIARALGRASVPVIAVSGEANDAYGATRYARKVVCPDLRDRGLIDTLLTIGRSLDQPGILIPTTDRSVTLLSEHRDALAVGFRHSLPDAGLIRELTDKSTIDRYATAHGFLSPRTFEIDREDDLDACRSALTFPCILKPRTKTVAFARPGHAADLLPLLLRRRRSAGRLVHRP
jgi:predicted ATP-grasp superfamily ATP-dependent carboligase